MNIFRRGIGHFTTITKHKIKVTALCFRCGLYKQGILHDFSKYSWVEFSAGVKYWQGNRSPIDKEKEMNGYSLGWLHHKGRNKHHWEYWLDNSRKGVVALRMPERYVYEMFCDRVAASLVYQKKDFKDSYPLEYYMRGAPVIMMHDDTRKLTEHLLYYLKDNGLETSIKYVKSLVKQLKKEDDKNIKK